MSSVDCDLHNIHMYFGGYGSLRTWKKVVSARAPCYVFLDKLKAASDGVRKGIRPETIFAEFLICAESFGLCDDIQDLS